ncbi:MAG TPA: hypothetical protein VM386_07695 [Acidimicrobiales bacterium]|nr:hypothetical protein [Acidimicrobiales bacterium]
MELSVDRAGRIEAYREEWAVTPEQLRERPSEFCQQLAWLQAVHITEVLVRVAAPRLEQGSRARIEMG